MSPDEMASAIVTQSIIIANLKAGLDQQMQSNAQLTQRIQELEAKSPAETSSRSESTAR
jgi:hypothetical protein